MILVIGARASGKRTYVETLGYTREDMANAIIDERPVVYNLQDLVASDPEGSDRFLDVLAEKDVVICNEVGSGIIPTTRSEREVREITGRLCIQLAQRAQRVVRIVCGLSTVIK